jgi:hypothetical protein
MDNDRLKAEMKRERRNRVTEGSLEQRKREALRRLQGLGSGSGGGSGSGSGAGASPQNGGAVQVESSCVIHSLKAPAFNP